MRGRAVMEHVLERMRRAGASEIRVVTRPEKRDVAELARRHGATVVEGYPPSVAHSLLLGLAGVPSDATVLFGLPDTVWDPPDGFVALAGALDDRRDVALGLFRSDELERSDVVVLGADSLVERVDVKPHEPRSDLIWGCAAARADALAGLERHDEPGHLFHELAQAGRVAGVEFMGEFIDIGTRAALARVSAVNDR